MTIGEWRKFQIDIYAYMNIHYHMGYVHTHAHIWITHLHHTMTLLDLSYISKFEDLMTVQ